MSQILALSLDCMSSPSILLKSSIPEQIPTQSYGRGFSWYNNEELSATVIKETKHHHKSTLVSSMQDFSRFHSTIFIGHIRGAAKKLVQKDTQPFNRSYAGRDWIFVHSGDLQSDFAKHIPLEKNPLFEPVGSTDSEHFFCLLLEKINNASARSLNDAGWENIYSWLVEVNKLGTINLMISDGLDIIVYHDANAFNPLFWLRSSPPHQITHFDADYFTIDITSSFDMLHTFILVANQNIGQAFRPMSPKQMIVLRRGQLIWDSMEKILMTSHEKSSIILPDKKIAGVKQQMQETGQDVHSGKGIQQQSILSRNHQIIDYVASSDRNYYSVLHETIYRYESTVNISKHLFHLHPISDHIQTVLDYKLLISVSGYGEFFEDVFGNIATFYRIHSPYNEIIIRSESVVSIVDNPSFKSELLHQRKDFPLVWLPLQSQMMSPYLLPPELPESELNELIEFAMSFVKRNDYDLMDVLNDINQTIYHDFKYVSGSTSITTTPYELYRSRRGVCQDFTNLFICLARLLNVPARYRTGYIHTAADYDNKIQSEASHAWVELYLPYIGWYGFDPTNGCLADVNHIRVACGRNYQDATPTSGTIYQGGGHEELEIKVQVNPLNDYKISNFA